MHCYIWPPAVSEGTPCSVNISVPQCDSQRFSELHVVLEDESLGCPVLDVQFPISQPSGTQSVTVIIGVKSLCVIVSMCVCVCVNGSVKPVMC